MTVISNETTRTFAFRVLESPLSVWTRLVELVSQLRDASIHFSSSEQKTNTVEYMCMCVCGLVCVRVRARVRVCSAFYVFVK